MGSLGLTLPKSVPLYLAMLKVLIPTGVALWKQQGVPNAHEAASSVLDKLADQLPALSSALLATEREQPDAADHNAFESPLSSLVSSLVSQTMNLRAPQAVMQMPHLLFVPLLWQR